MIDNSKLRGADIITSALFFILGIWILVEAFQMPLRDTYAGVISTWYVSPALMPIIIGIAVILLALSIFLHAMHHGGKESMKAIWIAMKQSKLSSDSNIRYASILIPLFAMVYMNLTRIDFFLTIVLFLGFTITIFYIDNNRYMRSVLAFYSVEMGILFIISIFKLDKLFSAWFTYLLDSIVVVMIVALTVYMRKQLKKVDEPNVKKKFKQAMWITYITPLLVVPIFRFLLRVPLPKEGIIVNLMSMAYYAVR